MKTVRSGFNLDRDENSLTTGLSTPDNEEEHLTQQQFKDETDINVLLKRFNITGQLPQNVRMPQYGDFTGIDNFQEALDALNQSDEAFRQMPAEIRDRFGNDPGKFVDFCLDDRNREEAARMGLVAPPAPPSLEQQTLETLKGIREDFAPATPSTGSGGK